MVHRVTLRTRLIVAFVLLSATVAITLAIIAYNVMELSEANLVEKTILQEAKMLANHFSQSPDFIPKKQQHFVLFVSGPGKQDILPEEVEKFSKYSNSGEISINGVEYELIRIHEQPYTYYFLYDFSQFEIFESSVILVLFISILVCIALGVWIGMITSGHVIKPVSWLAASLEQQPDKDGIVNIPYDFAEDEVGILARKFSQYNDRIKSYIEREKTFTSNASHELRTPLTVIAGAAEVLAGSPSLAEKDKDIVARICHETQVMAELINLLLMLSRDPGQLTATDEFIEVNAAIREQINRIDEECRTKGIELEFIEKNQLVIHGSRKALDIILRNLLNNSVQYTAKGKIIISVQQDSIIIEDTGLGISEGMQSRVFERFFRGEPNKFASHSGVGLALVQQLCGLYKWNILLDTSKKYVGARFIFCFTQ